MLAVAEKEAEKTSCLAAALGWLDDNSTVDNELIQQVYLLQYGFKTDLYPLF